MSGGQYSLLRATFGLALGVALALQDGPAWLRVVGAASSFLFAIGAVAPIAAVVAAIAWTLLVGAITFLDAPWAALVPVVLVVHALLPRAPYGSIPALGRTDPGGGWRFPTWCRWLAWAGVLALAVAAEFAVDGTLSDATLPRARIVACIAGLWPPLRPFAFLVLVGEEAAAHFDAQPAHVLAARILALGILFDPAWIPARVAAVERVYYDGSCGLCHRAVRFLLAEDVDGSRFRFAPLGGDAFEAHVPPAERRALPDSVIVGTEDGRLLVRSDAALHLLERLGGAWRILGLVAGIVPRAVRDAAYDGVASVRKRLFRAPKEACPLLPAALRERFEA